MLNAPNIFLVGPMGSGKTAVGRRLATRLGLQFAAPRGHRQVRIAQGIGHVASQGALVGLSIEEIGAAIAPIDCA